MLGLIAIWILFIELKELLVPSAEIVIQEDKAYYWVQYKKTNKHKLSSIEEIEVNKKISASYKR